MLINARKTANVFFTGASYFLSLIAGKPMIFGMPVSVTTELTNHCNLGCPECPSGSGQMERAKGYMNIDLYTRILNELKPFISNISMYFQGEPMLHPDFFSFLEKNINVHSVVSTNGHYLTPENSDKLAVSSLNRIIISLDGTDQVTYSKYRKNGNAEIVKKGIFNLSEAVKRNRSDLKVEIQFLVNRYNESGIPDIKSFAASVNASLKLKSMQIIRKEDIEYWQPSVEKFRRYALIDGKYQIKSSLPDRCLRLWLNPVVTWDGKVVPCCFDKDARWIMGDLNLNSFREIWYGEKYNNFRNMILGNRKGINICSNCTSGLRNVKV
jgi:radical SAM protein with 4Fe4S-binding SPASM domain